MKTLQLQKNIIDRLYKEEIILQQEDNENIYFSDAFTIWIINKNENFINIEKVKSVENLTNYVNYFNKEKSLTVDNLSLLLDKKYNGKIIAGECEEKKFYFKKDNLKYFDNNYTLCKMDNNPFNPIYVLENDVLKGLFMPINIDNIK
ncbi:hypothetical protein [Anaerococcus rubeinfantis]|uniref:hypothetical protein n=1 Tax=Anaerococcus rubeinfantis TaxID=1720199 RepID=UPI00073E5D11|nr:hypothetical protein [Anaerococcus rubeinfantis]